MHVQAPRRRYCTITATHAVTLTLIAIKVKVKVEPDELFRSLHAGGTL
jgi:hypothetical protein